MNASAYSSKRSTTDRTKISFLIPPSIGTGISRESKSRSRVHPRRRAGLTSAAKVRRIPTIKAGTRKVLVVGSCTDEIEWQFEGSRARGDFQVAAAAEVVPDNSSTAFDTGGGLLC